MSPRKKSEAAAPKKVAKKQCRCDELEARLVALEARPEPQSVDSALVSRLRNAVNGLLKLQSNGKGRPNRV